MWFTSNVEKGAIPLLVFAVFLCFVKPLPGQTAGDVRDLLTSRVGDLTSLTVPADDADLPQATLEGGGLDPRFAITPDKVRLGKFLFFDPVRSNHILTEFGGMPSTSQTGSCGSCHMGEAATKAGVVVSVSVGGEGRHRMAVNGTKTVERSIIEGLEDRLPTGIDRLDEGGNVIVSGSHDAIDAPGRVAPSVVGFAFNNRLLWGGEAGEPNAEGYPAQEDIVRKASMGHRMANPDTSHLQSNAVYVELFRRAFPDESAAADASGDLNDLINLDTQFRAIAAFARTVITRDSPWDRFLAGDDPALTETQLRGAWLFAATTEAGGANCIACHSGPALNKRLGDEAGLLVEENFDNLGTMEHPLQDLARATLEDPDHHDFGRMGVTGDPGDAYEFKSPTLRQLRDAAPFFHGGELGTVREVVEYFNNGVAANPLAGAEANLSPLFTNPRGAGLVGLGLSGDDIDALVDFLENGLYDRGLVSHDPASPTRTFELNQDDLTYGDDLKALGAVDGWLPSFMPNGFNDEKSRAQLVFRRGSMGNGDDRIDLADSIFLLNFLFRGGKAPSPMVAGDVNDDDRVNLGDAVYLVVFLFRGGDFPPPPYEEPGQDLTF